VKTNRGGRGGRFTLRIVLDRDIVKDATSKIDVKKLSGMKALVTPEGREKQSSAF